jgi:hypothetical protein
MSASPLKEHPPCLSTFLSTDDGETLFCDEVGLKLADDQAARDQGSTAMGEMAKEYLPGGPPQKNITMWVRNEQGQAVLQLSLSFAVQPLK